MIKPVRFLFVVGCGIAFAAPAAAFQVQQTAASDGTETTASTQIICRRVAAPTGTRIGTRRICKTRHEWDVIRDEARDTIDEATSRNQFCHEC